MIFQSKKPTRPGADTAADKVDGSTKSALMPSRSLSKTSLLEALPPPPSYEEVTATTTTTTTTPGTLKGHSNNLPSPGQCQLASIFQFPVCTSKSASNKRSCISFSEQGKALLLVYYVLVKEGLDMTNSSHVVLPGYRAEDPSPAARAWIHAVGNYAFMLALLQASKQYKIARDTSENHLRLRLPLPPPLGNDPQVLAIRQHVKRGMVNELLQHNWYYKLTSKIAVLWEVDQLTDVVLDDAVHVFDGFKDSFGKSRNSIDTGVLDGPKVHACWSLFKTVLVETTGYDDLLPPPEYNECNSRCHRNERVGTW